MKDTLALATLLALAIYTVVMADFLYSAWVREVVVVASWWNFAPDALNIAVLAGNLIFLSRSR